MVVVPAGHGVLWVRRGIALFARAPLPWMLAAMTYWLITIVVGIVPYLGLAAALVATPAFAVGFMAMSRSVDEKRTLELALLFAGFRGNLAPLVTLGGIYLVAVLVVLAATQLADGGGLMRWMLLGQGPARGSPEADALGEAAMLGFVLFVPVILAFWFAPVLVAWENLPASKALFFSFFAALRNWRAFAVYGIALAVVGGLAPALVFTLFAALARGTQIAAAFAQLFALLLVVTLLPAYYASVYASYRDVFSPPDPTPATA